MNFSFMEPLFDSISSASFTYTCRAGGSLVRIGNMEANSRISLKKASSEAAEKTMATKAASWFPVVAGTTFWIFPYADLAMEKRCPALRLMALLIFGETIAVPWDSEQRSDPIKSHRPRQLSESRIAYSQPLQ